MTPILQANSISNTSAGETPSLLYNIPYIHENSNSNNNNNNNININTNTNNSRDVNFMYGPPVFVPSQAKSEDMLRSIEQTTKLHQTNMMNTHLIDIIKLNNSINVAQVVTPNFQYSYPNTLFKPHEINQILSFHTLPAHVPSLLSQYSEELVNNNSNSSITSSSSSSSLVSIKPKRRRTRKRYICKFPGCDKDYSSSGHMTRHYITHQGIRPYVCKFTGCSKSFTRHDNLLSHNRTVHEKKDDEKIKKISNLHLSTKPIKSIKSVDSFQIF